MTAELLMFLTFVEPLMVALAATTVAGVALVCLAFGIYVLTDHLPHRRDSVNDRLDTLTDDGLLARITGRTWR